MKVSTRVHYGLRAMTELARSYREDRLLSISEIARNESLPLSYLEQLVGELRRAGLVEGTHGRPGGERPSPTPEENLGRGPYPTPPRGRAADDAPPPELLHRTRRA